MKLGQKLAIRYIKARLNILALVSKRKAAEKAFKLFCTPQRKSNKNIPSLFNKAEKVSFMLDGITIKGYRFNHPQPQKALIIHGFESAAKNFDRYVQPLINKGYEVLAFDAPAHGRSEGKQINLPLYLKTLKAITDQYGPINSFIAHSFGGAALALLLEGIPHDTSAKAVLIAPATETTTAIDSFFRFLELSPEIRTEFEKLILERGGHESSYYSIRRALPNIKASILWVHDEDDDITPLSDALKIKADNPPHVLFHITKGLGHRKIYRDAAVVKRIIDFL